MRKMVDIDKVEIAMTKLIYTEQFSRTIEIDGDEFVFPSFTFCNGYCLARFMNRKGTLYFSTNKVSKIDLDVEHCLEMDESSLCRSGLIECSFSEMVDRLRMHDYIIPGISDSLENLERIADYEVAFEVDDDYYNRIMALNLTQYVEVGDKEKSLLYKSNYTNVVQAANNLYYALVTNADAETVSLLRKKMATHYILFISTKYLYKAVMVKYEPGMVVLNYKNIFDLI